MRQEEYIVCYFLFGKMLRNTLNWKEEEEKKLQLRGIKPVHYLYFFLLFLTFTDHCILFSGDNAFGLQEIMSCCKVEKQVKLVAHEIRVTSN